MAEEQEMDIFYVCEKTLKALEEKVKKSEAVTAEEVKELLFPESADDDDMMIPVDMAGVGEEFEDPEAMAEKLGPKGTVEAFAKARDHFEKNKDKTPEDERASPMCVAAWKEVLADDAEGEEEEE